MLSQAIVENALKKKKTTTNTRYIYSPLGNDQAIRPHSLNQKISREYVGEGRIIVDLRSRNRRLKVTPSLLRKHAPETKLKLVFINNVYIQFTQLDILDIRLNGKHL